MAQAILERTQTQELLTVAVEVQQEARFKQATPGRPSQQTVYVRVPRHKFLLHWSLQDQALENEAMEGIFPLVLNDKHLSLQEVLLAYKHQPRLERRFEQLKSVLEMMPVFLKSPRRIEALLLLYFLALLVHALIELQLRRRMAAEGLADLPLYPEQRACERPTADRVLHLFADVRCHRLLSPLGTCCRIFQDPLTQKPSDPSSDARHVSFALLRRHSRDAASFAKSVRRNPRDISFAMCGKQGGLVSELLALNQPADSAISLCYGFPVHTS